MPEGDVDATLDTLAKLAKMGPYAPLPEPDYGDDLKPPELAVGVPGRPCTLTITEHHGGR